MHGIQCSALKFLACSRCSVSGERSEKWSPLTFFCSLFLTNRTSGTGYLKGVFQFQCLWTNWKRVHVDSSGWKFAYENFAASQYSMMSSQLHVHVYSQLSLNGHLYKMDTSIKRTPGVGPCAVFQSFYCIKALYKMDTSLRRTVGAGPDGVRLRESWLYMYMYA